MFRSYLTVSTSFSFLIGENKRETSYTLCMDAAQGSYQETNVCYLTDRFYAQNVFPKEQFNICEILSHGRSNRFSHF